ncbi:TRP47 family tandem repeat effector [Ehrlichia japonica]|uniref:Putative immunodominant surface protein gp36 n=1 Tax=Ehrlichia japonica TaxID=391036 RepID=X5H1X6_9RICK|nr:TRP47 family tandem repeat effector [Ehrlichia japonica]AHX04839.1 putative immunodominant surface protein gp36 [Ehrlichia japonica]
MLHLTTEINNIDFSNNLHIDSGDRFVVTSNDMQLDVGQEAGHGYHLLFRNNGHVISDFHGVTAESFIFDIKNHNLKASFLVDLMAPFEGLNQTNHPDFLVNMHTVSDCVSSNHDSDCAFNGSHSHGTHARGEVGSLPAGIKSAMDQIVSPNESITVQSPVAAESVILPAVANNASDNSIVSENVNVPESVVSASSIDGVSEDTEDSNDTIASSQVSSETQPRSRLLEMRDIIRDPESFAREEQVAAQFGGKYFYF